MNSAPLRLVGFGSPAWREAKAGPEPLPDRLARVRHLIAVCESNLADAEVKLARLRETETWLVQEMMKGEGL